MTDSKHQSEGGKARAKSLTKNRRSEIAKKAAEARWERAKDADRESLPKAIAGGPEKPLRIGDLEIPCYVLENGKRIIHQRGMVSALGMSRGGSSRGGGDRLAHFVGQKTLSPFVSNDLRLVTSEPLMFRTPRGMVAYGYDATVLADICDALLNARAAGVLSKQQEHIAAQAETLIRSFAKVGIVALIDEVTGYQDDRARDELNKLLAVYLSEERLTWAQRFPNEFYKQLYRLRNWNWPNNGNRTPFVGKLTNTLVYDRLPDGVLKELKARNPTAPETGRRKWKHHQFLSEDIGQPDLRDHLLQLVAIMRTSKDWGDFEERFNMAFPKPGDQITLDLKPSDDA